MNKNIILILVLSMILFSNYLDFEIVVNESNDNQNLFVSHRYQNHQYLAIIDPELIPKWYVVLNDGKGWDFKVNNNDHITYYQKNSQNINSKSWFVMDKNMQEIDSLDCINGYKADYHDIQYTSNNGYILMSYVKQEIDIPQTTRIDTANVLIIQEFDQNDNLIYQWNNSEHMIIDDYIPYFNFNQPYLNWTHGNSIDIDGENLIISNRAMSEIIKYNRFNGDVAWILGGPLNDFTFINDPFLGPHKQHDARLLDNGNLMIFDNGYGANGTSDARPARVVEYQLDEINLTANLVWEFTHPNNYVSLNQGSSQRLENGNTLISWGGIPNQGSIITEVTYNKDIILELRYPIGASTYKARKSNWDFDINLIEGDLNFDENVNILDCIHSVNYILSTNQHSPFYYHKIDINKDSNIDILDLIDIIDIIISLQ